ncbi:MAG: DUF1828 domain-containing protein [Methanocorpusculum sp.]|nr:DUF1828 domain-containing protein [Methanocorpusculum sp.]
MVVDVHSLIKSYKDWLADNITTRETAYAVELTLPILDRDNDYLQLYLKEDKPDVYLLTDAGYTISNLELSGCSLTTEKRRQLLMEAVTGFGITVSDEDDLQTTANDEDFPQKLNNLIQAVLAVDDIAYLTSSNVTTIFINEIKAWLARNKVRYSPNVSLMGKNKIYYSFDILIPASPEAGKPERIIESFGNFDRKQAEALAYRWNEVRYVRDTAQLYVIYNNSRVSKSVQEICSAENIVPVSYTNIESIAQEIRA